MKCQLQHQAACEVEDDPPRRMQRRTGQRSHGSFRCALFQTALFWTFRAGYLLPSRSGRITLNVRTMILGRVLTAGISPFVEALTPGILWRVSAIMPTSRVLVRRMAMRHGDAA
jgi:hypothetical protein